MRLPCSITLSFVRCLVALAFVASPLALGSTVARAQSDDEFGDDAFEEAVEAPPPRATTTAPRATTTAPRATTTAPRAAQPDAVDDDADEFGGDAEEAPEAAPSPGRGTPVPAEGDARVRTGDLLRDRASEAWRSRRFPLHNSWFGSVGGIHVVDAGSGPSESFRVQLLTDFFSANSFLTPGADHSHIGGSLSVSWSPWDFLELYGAIASYANSTSDPAAQPQLFQVLGDSRLGVKGYYHILPFLTVGGDLSLSLLNTVGDIGLVLGSTSVGIRGNLTADLRNLDSAIPLIARLNLQYYVDNSSNLTNDVEQARYAGLPTTGADAARPFGDETRQLLTRFERYSLGINRTDFFHIGIGLEAPLEVMTDFTISPILEWTLSTPVNRQGYNCLYLPDPTDGSRPVAGDDGCLARQGFNSFPSTLTLGARVLPPVRGLSITLAADIGTSGMSTFVRELAGNAPYDVILGLGYAFDTVPRVERIEREVERRVEVRIPPPVRGRVVGTVVEQGSGTPVSGAAVAYVGRDLTAQQTGATGGFTTYELDPGDVAVQLSHPDYNDGSCSATIPAEGGDVQLRCEMVARPRVGTIRGSLHSDGGSPISGAQLQITGPQAFTATTDSSGHFTREGLPPGTYMARIDVPGYLLAQESFLVHVRETTTPELIIVARPSRSLVTLRAREIAIRRQVNFGTDSADILGDSTALLSELADTLLRHPELLRVEIQGHTDSNGDDDANLQLSQRRADAVRQWLITAGVDAGRLTAQGYGEARPLVPNLTAGNRARNRRVQFIIEQRTEE